MTERREDVVRVDVVRNMVLVLYIPAINVFFRSIVFLLKSTLKSIYLKCIV